MANALVYVVSMGNNSFATNVAGTGGTQNHMLGEWLLLSQFNKDVYPLIAAANVASSQRKLSQVGAGVPFAPEHFGASGESYSPVE